MTDLRWWCLSCPAQGVGQGESHTKTTKHPTTCSTGDGPALWPFCACQHRQDTHAWVTRNGPHGRCLVAGCGCGGYERESDGT